MDAVLASLASHVLLVWLAIGAVFLVAELHTGSGWLLWPAGSAAVTGVVALSPYVTVPGQAAVFAALTVVSTYLGRRFIQPRTHAVGHINEPKSRLVGRTGLAVGDFAGGQGRVFVDGKEWAAELDGDGEVAAGDRLHVTALIGGARLQVRAG